MSLEKLTKKELQEAAEAFGVEWMKSNPNKNDMIKELEEEGVSWEMYRKAFPPEEEPSEEESDGDFVTPETKTESAEKKFSTKAKQVLVKMTRGNPSYEVRGYNFTKTHPFLLVNEDDAEFLVNDLGGFAIATPREVESYYS